MRGETRHRPNPTPNPHPPLPYPGPASTPVSAPVPGPTVYMCPDCGGYGLNLLDVEHRPDCRYR